MPIPPPKSSTKTETRIWEKEVDEYVRKKTYLNKYLKTLYSLVWGQCTDFMRTRIEVLDKYEEMSTQSNSIDLLKVIRSLAYNFQSKKYRPLAISDGTRRFYRLY
jgi:hypothetical protein